MAMNGIDNCVSGIVRSVNERGLKLEGHAAWFNFSKYSAADVVPPERGDTVAVVLDARGFIRSLTLVDSAAPSQPPRVAGASDAPSTKDRTITRLAVLKAAAEYAASKPSSSSSDVLKIAACWERWVLRDDAPPPVVADDLDEAF